MSVPKRGLGRGLGALIPSVSESAAEEVSELPTAVITPNPNQPRTSVDDEQIDELTDSVRKVGVLQPIIVRAHGEDYQIVAGERRWRAARAAGLQRVPVRVVAVGEAESLELALIENLQRQDLNPMEEAHGYRRLMTEYQMTQAEMADKVSKSRSAVANTLRLLDLPDEVQELLAEDKISAGHARAILAVPEEDLRLKLAVKIVEGGLSVREAENLARLFAAGGSERTPRPVSPKAYKLVARKLRRLLATSVRVRQTKDKGKIEIDFHGEDELARIFRLLTEPRNGTGA